MLMLIDAPAPRHVPADTAMSCQLVKLIRKLRWMGLEDEAELMEMQLALSPVPAMDSVLAAPCDTD
jgi:hypothetical protein